MAIKHIVLTEKEHNELFNPKLNQGKDGWALFYEKYPRWPGIITLSRPGFSADGTIAVIYMGIQRGWLNGGGRIHVLEKKENNWVKTELRIGPSWRS